MSEAFLTYLTAVKEAVSEVGGEVFVAHKWNKKRIGGVLALPSSPTQCQEFVCEGSLTASATVPCGSAADHTLRQLTSGASRLVPDVT